MCQGAITIDGDSVSRNLAYYVVAHASKFVRPGSVRIQSTAPESLPNVAFRTTGGKRVLVVVNASPAPQTFHHPRRPVDDRNPAARRGCHLRLVSSGVSPSYAGVHSPTIFPSGSPNHAKLPAPGMSTLGTTTLPPNVSAFAMCSPMSSTCT
jgi:hypothetical protein